MESLIPVEIYSYVFFHSLLLIVFLAAWSLYSFGYTINSRDKIDFATPLLLIAVVLYIGLRPISGQYFADMGVYYNSFKAYAAGKELDVENDFLWYGFVKVSSSFMTAKTFFFVCAAIYVLPVYQAAKNWMSKDSFFLFLMIIASFSFWSYGTNGLRNGAATSFFILGLSLYRYKFWQIVLLVVSYFIHGSMIIPITAYVLTLFNNNPRYYLFAWILSIPVSLVLGQRIEPFVMSLGFGDDRVRYLTLQGLEDLFSSTGFRWDFLIYSSVPVFVGYYFILKRKFTDKLYVQIFNIYVAANAFWILVIRAAFSNRFAYLSWFLMGIVVFYPFFKRRFFRYQQLVLLGSAIAYYLFTYVRSLMSLNENY